MDATRKNNFDFLRLLAALMVIYGHGRDLKGLAPPVLWNAQTSGLGLDMFFAISGYLVTDSWERGPRLGAFLARRALRIFPGLAAAVLVTAFGIGAVATSLPLGAYLRSHRTWDYLFNIPLYLKLYLPGVFAGRLLGGAVNGSLWSLFPEFCCYLTVPLFGLLRGPGRLAALAGATALCGGLALHMFAIGWGHLFYSLDVKYGLAQAPFFLAGALLRAGQNRFPELIRADGAILCCAATYAWTWLPAPWDVVVQWFTLPYIVICFGRASTPILRDAAGFGDLSYGLYLYAFPVQQLVLEHGPQFATIECTVVSAGLAWLSWHLVEHPALRFKPGRPLRPAPSTPAALHEVATPSGVP